MAERENIFDAEGVTNAVWALVMQSGSQWDCMQKEMWPGNNLVDWVMWDHYYVNSETFASGTSRFYNWLNSNSDATHNYSSHPYGIAEWGSWQDNQSDVYQLYIDGGNALKNNTYPNLKMWLIWDSVGTYDSRIQYTKTGVLDNNEQNIFIANWAQNPAFSDAVSPPGDTSKPTVSITSPANGSTVSGTVIFNVSASDNVGVTRVTLYWDGTNIIRNGTSQGTYGWGSAWNSASAGNGTHTITATAYDAAGNSQAASIDVTVNNTGPPPAPVINSFTANPSTTTVGQTSTLSWSAANTSSCSITPGGPQNTTATSWTTLTYTTAGDNTYTLTCQNSAGSTVTKTAVVTVYPAPVPPGNVSLSADKTSIQTGSSVLLSWSSSGSSSCTLNPGNYTAGGNSSSKAVTPASTTTYTVTCSNSAGSSKSNPVTVTVTATPPPPADPIVNGFTANPANVTSGATSTLSWQTSNVASGGCALTPSPLSSTDGNGSWTTPALTASASYTLTCQNNNGKKVSASVSVIVGGQPAPPAPAPTAPTPGSSDKSGTITATTGQKVVNAQAAGSIPSGSLITLDPTTVTDSNKIDNTVKVEFYSGDKLIQTVTKAPFALDSGKAGMKPGTYNLTQRTYYTDGSMSQQSQLVTITAKPAAVVKKNGAAAIWIVALVAVGGVASLIWQRRRLMPGGGKGNNTSQPVIVEPTSDSN